MRRVEGAAEQADAHARRVRREKAHLSAELVASDDVCGHGLI
jgi:hypothetical protein